MNDAPSLMDSLAHWTSFPKLERRFEPRRTRAAAAQVIRRLGDIEPKPPEPYDLKALYWRVMGSWQRHYSLEGVSSRDLQRLPWVLFYESRDRRRSRHQGPIGWLAGKPRVVQDYRRWLLRARRARPVQALLREFLRVYPTDLRTFDDLREILQVSVMGGSSPPPSLRKWRQRCREFQLLEADGGMAFVRKLVNAAEDPDDILTDAGLDAGLARCGFLKSGIRKYLPNISSQLAQNRIHAGILDRVLNLLESEGKLRFDEQSVRVEIASRLLGPFVERAPDTPAKERLQSFFVRHFGHPNLRSRKYKWAGVRDDIRRVVIRWLVGRALDQFFLLIRETALDRHWTYREAFWKKILHEDLIDDIWFLLGPRARDDLWRLKGDDDLIESTGSLKGAGGDQSVLIMRMPGVTVAEWSHNGSCRCWLDGNRYAPKLYQKEYSRYTLMRRSDFAQPHYGSELGYWQDRVAEWLHENTGVILQASTNEPNVPHKNRETSAHPVAADKTIHHVESGSELTACMRQHGPRLQVTADESAVTCAKCRARIGRAAKRVAAIQPEPMAQETLAGILDDLLFRPNGVTWVDLVDAAKKHSDKHQLKTRATRGLVRAHARFRAKHPEVELIMDDERAQLVRRNEMRTNLHDPGRQWTAVAFARFTEKKGSSWQFSYFGRLANQTSKEKTCVVVVSFVDSGGNLVVYDAFAAHKCKVRARSAKRFSGTVLINARNAPKVTGIRLQVTVQ